MAPGNIVGRRSSSDACTGATGQFAVLESEGSRGIPRSTAELVDGVATRKTRSPDVLCLMSYRGAILSGPARPARDTGRKNRVGK
jgi:hypothetical protein